MYLGLESSYYKLKWRRVNTLNALLHHMVPILIFNTLQHVSIQLSYKVVLKWDHKHRNKQSILKRMCFWFDTASFEISCSQHINNNQLHPQSSWRKLCKMNPKYQV